jgi:peptidoglycan-N-acetylglucosamine deacetylase
MVGHRRSFGAVVGAVVAGGAVAAASWIAWAVRGRSSSVFAPSVWHGPRDRRRIALTFDDGPTPGTRVLLEMLEKRSARATFFQCGVQVRRNPAIARDVAAAGHEIGNHTDTHARLWLRPASFLIEEIGRAQRTIIDTTCCTPRFFRAPYGVRWPGLARAQARFGLTGAMWSTIGRDWTLDADAVHRCLLGGMEAGAILCLHDGRELAPDPDIGVTVRAVDLLLQSLAGEGWEFATLSELLGYSGAVCPKTSSPE